MLLEAIQMCFIAHGRRHGLVCESQIIHSDTAGDHGHSHGPGGHAHAHGSGDAHGHDDDDEPPEMVDADDMDGAGKGIPMLQHLYRACG